MRFKALSNWILPITLAAVVPLLFYSAQFAAPGDFLFSLSGDGLKNYFSFLYHEQWGNSWAHFEGMNYPYGELHLFTDGQPSLLLLHQLLESFIPGLSPISTMNAAMLWSLPISYFFIYGLLRHFRTTSWIAAIGALALVFLSPQVFRMNGHYGLAYACAIPMTWFFLLKMRRNLKFLWLSFLFVSILFFFFIHPYLGLILAAFVLLESVLNFLMTKNRSLVNSGLEISGALMPLVLFVAFTSALDTHPERTPDPWGIYRYHAKPTTVFFPHHEPLKPVLQKMVPLDRQTWEGWAYIGLGGVIMCLVLLSRWIFRMVRRREFVLRVHSNPEHLSSAFWAALLLLLFSMAFPIKQGFGFLLEMLPPLKQFRSLGRFAWIFYYVMGIYSVYSLGNLARSLSMERKRLLAASLPIFFTALFIWEGWAHHSEISKAISSPSSSLDQFDFPNLDPDDYQAVIPLPFFHHGSENFELAGTDASRTLAYLFSLKTGLPIFGGSMARTSVPESKKIIQMLGPTYLPKEIQGDLPDDRPFLLLLSPDALNEYEQIWVDASRLIEKNKAFELRRVDPQVFFMPMVEGIPLDSDFVQMGAYRMYAKGFYLFSDFEELENRNGMFGGASYVEPKKNYGRVIELERDEIVEETEFIFWLWNGDYSQTQVECFIEAVDADGKTYRLSSASGLRSQNIWGDWSQIRMDCKLEAHHQSVRLVTKGDERSKQNVLIDNLLIKAKDSQFILKGFGPNEEYILTDGGFSLLEEAVVLSPAPSPESLPQQ
jgi:hypothetical protein